MFDGGKCEECLYNTCIYDYGLDCSNFSCLCKNRAYEACEDCKSKGDNNIVADCEDYIQDK